MAIETLQKLSVPTSGEPKNISVLMPKLQYRFRVIFAAFGISNDKTELTRQVIDVTKPTVSYDKITIESYNSRTYLAGKHTWDPITINIREDANNSIQKLIGEQMQKQFDFYEQASAKTGDTYKFDTKIEVLDGGNGAHAVSVIDTFHLVGCYIENATYNQLSYATSDQLSTTLTISYDNAIQYGVNGATDGIGDVRVPRNTDRESTTGQSF